MVEKFLRNFAVINVAGSYKNSCKARAARLRRLEINRTVGKAGLAKAALFKTECRRQKDQSAPWERRPSPRQLSPSAALVLLYPHQ